MTARRIVAAAVVVLTGVWLGAFAAETIPDMSEHTYPVDFGGATWISTVTAAPRVYFRLDLPLPAAPESATLWLDADQGYSVAVNRIQLDNDSKLARQGAMLIAHPIDITRQLHAGDNVVALQVSNWDSRTAAIRARLTVVSGGGRTDYVTGTARWLATSDISQVTSRGANRAPRYSSVAFDAAAWPLARRIPPVRISVPSTVPTEVVDAPLRAAVLGGPRQSADVVASVSLDLPDDPTDAWFRIIAPGKYVVLLDGSVLTSRSMPPPITADIYNLGRFLHRGHNVLAVHATADSVATVYADGSVELPNQPPIPVSTGHRWAVADASTVAAMQPPSPSTATDMGPTASVFPTGTSKVVFPVSTLQASLGPAILMRIVALVGLLAVWLLVAAAVARASDTGFGIALAIGAAVQVPGAATLAMLEMFASLAQPDTAFPYIPPVVGLVILMLVVPQALAALLLVKGSLPLGRWPMGPARAWAVWGRARWSALRSRRRRVGAIPSLTTTGDGDEPEAQPIPLTGPRRRRRGAVLDWIRIRPAQVTITGIAVICGLLTGYQLDYEPYWQDEIASLNAAQGMRTHIIPQLPSTFVYWKGELYSALIAVVGAVFGDQPSTLRIITVLWYVATVLAFGLFLVPLFLGPARRVLQVATTLVFATAPMELTWARDVRMYQQAQFFAIVFIGLFLVALRSNRTRYIAASAVVLVLMYLSHEETFVFLPAIPVVFLAAMRLRWIRDRRWWLLGGGAFVVIAVQYVLATVTHPPFYGFDHSNKPYVTFDARNFFYYFRQVYFAVKNNGPSLMILSSLALLASVMGAVRRSLDRLYLAAFLWIPVIALSTIFSPKINRYVFVTLPVVFVLAALGATDVVGFLRAKLTPLNASIRQDRIVRRALTAALLPGFVWVMCSVSGGVSGYGLAVARLAGTPEARKHVDFDYAIGRVAAQIGPGDTVVTLCPPDIAAYYLKRTPNYIIATGRDKLLYLMDQGGMVVDTTYGVPQVFSVQDLQLIIQAHHRVWLITDQGAFLQGVDRHVSQLITNQFDEVSEGYGAAVYFRGE